MTALCILGPTGRMGHALIEAALSDLRVDLSAVLAKPGNAVIGQDAASLVGRPLRGVRVTDDVESALDACDALIDFTSPATTLAFAEKAARHGKVHVIGTTGLTREHEARLQQYATAIPIVCAPNMSATVTLLTALIEQTAHILDDSYDIEVVEMHHRHKVDAPSGTALGLGKAAAKGRGVDFDRVKRLSREGHTGERPRGEIGFATLRGGSVVGDHTVLFAGDGERLELTHKSEGRATYARGAIRAALWAQGRAPGLYSMRDVLGI